MIEVICMLVGFLFALAQVKSAAEEVRKEQELDDRISMAVSEALEDD
jgi:hypothetical protein